MTHLGIIKELGFNFSLLNDGDLKDRRWGEMEESECVQKSHPSNMGRVSMQ